MFLVVSQFFSQAFLKSQFSISPDKSTFQYCQNSSFAKARAKRKRRTLATHKESILMGDDSHIHLIFIAGSLECSRRSPVVSLCHSHLVMVYMTSLIRAQA